MADTTAAEALAAAEGLRQALQPDVPPSMAPGALSGSVQFILPCISKTQLLGFADWHAAYVDQTDDDKLLDHSLLLDQGILLSARSSHLAGMAGASLWDGDGWIAVSFADLIGEAPPQVNPASPELQQPAHAAE